MFDFSICFLFFGVENEYLFFIFTISYQEFESEKPILLFLLFMDLLAVLKTVNLSSA